MSTLEKEEYYTNNSILNMHIDNIMSFRDFLNSILSDIKNGEYNIQMIKNISHTVDKFYNEISNNTDIFKPNTNADTNEESKPLIPRAVETYNYSDDEDVEADIEDVESDITVVSNVNSASSDTPPKNSAYSIEKYFQHNPSDIYNNDPEFLDDIKPSTPKTSYYNTTSNSSVISDYSKIRDKQHDVNSYNYYQSLYANYKHEVEEDTNSNKYPNTHANKYPNKYPNTHANYKHEVEEDTNLNTYANKYPNKYPNKYANYTRGQYGSYVKFEEPVTTEPKYVDKLAQDFLNNNLELDKYHYLKNFNQNNIDNFCFSSYIY